VRLFRVSSIQTVEEGRLDNIQSILSFVPEARRLKLLNWTTVDSWSCLHLACFFGHSAIAHYLVSMNVSCNRETLDHWTPLQLACYLGHLGCVKALLKHACIQLNKMTASRGTGLHLAAMKGHLEILKRLIEAGACMTLEDNTGQQPIDLSSKPEILGLLKKCMGKDVRKRSIGSVPQTLADSVFKLQSFKLYDSLVYLVLQPAEGLLLRYSSEEAYLNNQNPLDSLKLQEIQDVRLIRGRLFQTKKAFNFIVESKTDSTRYYTWSEEQSQGWVHCILEAIQFCHVHKVGLPSPKTPASPQMPFLTISKRGDRRNYEMQAVELKEPPLFQLDRRLSKLVGDHASSDDASKLELSPEPELVVIQDLLPSQSPPPCNDPCPSQEMTLKQEAAEGSEQSRVKQPISVDSFVTIREIGSGSFSKVYKVQMIDDGRVFAMKTLSKDYLRKRKQLKYAVREGKILQQLDHPFIIKLNYAFQTPKNLHFVLDYCPNGDLRTQLNDHGPFTEAEAKFFIVELILGLEYLHGLDILYRDLKPENILLDANGHIRMTDFGLAKDSKNEASVTFVGSPAYLAPEMLTHRISNKASDVYALGLVSYELICGKSPFFSQDLEELFESIREGLVTYPADMTPDTLDFISGLLNPVSDRRPTVTQCKKHPLFRDVDWESYLHCSVNSPAMMRRVSEINRAKVNA
jgi:tRNA A-37 threonylcarbamoyl transferase component Bud32